MIRIWRGIFRYWTTGDKMGFFAIIFSLLIIIVSMIITAKYLGKLLSAIAISQNS